MKAVSSSLDFDERWWFSTDALGKVGSGPRRRSKITSNEAIINCSSGGGSVTLLNNQKVYKVSNECPISDIFTVLNSFEKP
jgi:hypothetical protein